MSVLIEAALLLPSGQNFIPVREEGGVGGGLNTEVFKGGLVLSHLDAAADAGPESQLVSTPAALETRGGLMEARWACRLQRFPPRRLRVSADRRHISSFWFVLH